ncbi:MAG TPA: FAD-dependent oxidoreductase [Nitrososphaeraceae archaeon]|nr:FAD-dependent oxidoreductase [Nitrososphaeraceae archaeon]
MNIDPNRVGTFPFRKADPEERKKNFSEVQQPYTEEEVMREADRCLLCGTPVCIDACPVLLDVRGMNEAVARGDFKKAYERIRETNPLVGVTGRCCPQLQGLCEDACVLRWSGQPIGIGLIQRYVADWERRQHEQQRPYSQLEQKDQQRPDAPISISPNTGKKVAVIGAGPAGLAAAELLKRYGHDVVIYEELSTPGGTAWYGIPDYHLPKDVLLYEIDKIKGMGIEIKTGTKVGKDITLSQLTDSGSDAILIAAGSKDTVKLDTPGIDLRGIYDGYQFLESVYVNGVDNYLKNEKNRSNTYELGKQVIVIGGGDTALDCARTALRLTKGNVTIVYRRTENDMPADPIMLEEAKEEGVKFIFLAEPKSYEADSEGHVKATIMNAMRLGAPDQSGRKTPESIPDKEFNLECSSVLLAVGRGPNSFLQNKMGIKTGKKNSIAINDQYKTSMNGVFAAGDVTTGETLVVKAMSSGREAAERVHEYLMNLEENHMSFYERYYIQNSYDRMLEGGKTGPPPE